MKNYIFILLSFLFFLISCSEKFLEIEPETFVAPEYYYSSESQVELASNALYAAVQTLHKSRMWWIGELRSDNTTWPKPGMLYGDEQADEFDEFCMSADHQFMDGFWSSAYNGIMRSNYMIKYMDNATFSDEAIRDTRMGEALFFRAWYYFNLVRMFGDVPLVTEPVTSPETAAQYQREPLGNIYDQVIIPDALAAIDLLPDAYTGDDVGRVTSGAARTLLAKVYMTLGNFQEAVTLCQAITQMDYELLPSYESIFNPDNKNHEESIFEIQFLGSDANGEYSTFMQMFGPYSSGTNVYGADMEGFGGLGLSSGYNQPTTSMINAYEDGDLRKDISLKEYWINQTTGDTTWEAYINKYNYPMVKLGQEDVNWPVYRYADVLLMLAESLNEIGFPNQQAFNLLNQVRSRAGLPDKTQGNADPALAVNSQDEFRTAVAQERRVELAFENHRWFDLLRTDKAVEVMTAHGVEEKNLPDPEDHPYLGDDAYLTIRTLLAIPAMEVLSWGYTQNEGW